jgi:hypothetical protein
MAQIFDSLPSSQDCQVLCCYINATNQIQIVRIVNIPGWYFERAVFPGQRLLFEAVLDAELEIHTSRTVGAILADKIPCLRLRVKAEDGEVGK